MDATLPLENLRVIDMASLLAAPFCATLLGDFGAEVIKIELPQQGDHLRQYGKKVNGISLSWPTVSRNKKIITCDLRKPEGQDLVKRLVTVSDVVTENFRPGTLEKWNLGYNLLKEVNPGLIMVRISGYGQTGPYRRKPGFGRIAGAFGGLTYICGYPDRPPVNPGTPTVPDYLAGIMGALGALLAKSYRDRTGQGQEVDIALYEPVLMILDQLIPVYDKLGYIRERKGPQSEATVPHSHFQGKDGKWIAIACTTQRMFERLCAAMGRKDLLQDPRCVTMDARVQNREYVNSLVQEWVGRNPAQEVVQRLDEAEVAVGMINDAKDLVENEHIRARENIIEITHPKIGKVKIPGIFPRLSVSPGVVRTCPDVLGENNEQIYGKLLGLTPAEIDNLRQRGII